jgi:N-acetylmuramoyl-L-alanine amidase
MRHIGPIGPIGLAACPQNSWTPAIPGLPHHRFSFPLIFRSLPSILCPIMGRGLACLGCLLFLATRAFSFDWQLIKEEGRDYIPLTDVARFYGFTKADYFNNALILSNPNLRLQTADGSRELYLNGLKFILFFPILRAENQLLISRMDLSKIVEPVLRPARIQSPPVTTVVLDPGHGGVDQGAQSLFSREKDASLDVALRARELLSKAGFSVRLTRASDVFIPLELRATFASHQTNALFVSIHFNAGLNPDANGVETYCLAPQGVPSTNNPFLTFVDFQPAPGNSRDPENIALATAMHGALVVRTGAFDRGIKRARFVVLRDIAIPAVLIEGGFLTNLQDAARIASANYRQLLAQAILQGVLTYNRALQRASPGPLMVQHPAFLSHPPVKDSAAIWDPLRSDLGVVREPR